MVDLVIFDCRFIGRLDGSIDRQIDNHQIDNRESDVLLRELSPGFYDAGGAVGQLAGLEVDLDVAAVEVTPDELLGQRILDVALDGATKRARAVRAVLAGDLDNPVDDLRGERDLELAVEQ